MPATRTAPTFGDAGNGKTRAERSSTNRSDGPSYPGPTLVSNPQRVAALVFYDRYGLHFPAYRSTFKLRFP